MYILPPSIPKRIEGYRWQSFTPPAAGKSRRFRGLICHRRSDRDTNWSGIGLDPVWRGWREMIPPPQWRYPATHGDGRRAVTSGAHRTAVDQRALLVHRRTLPAVFGRTPCRLRSGRLEGSQLANRGALASMRFRRRHHTLDIAFDLPPVGRSRTGHLSVRFAHQAPPTWPAPLLAVSKARPISSSPPFNDADRYGAHDQK